MRGDNRRRRTTDPETQERREVNTSDGLPILEKVEGATLIDDDVRRLRDDQHR